MFPPLPSLPINYGSHHSEMTHICLCDSPLLDHPCVSLKPWGDYCAIDVQMKLFTLNNQPSSRNNIICAILLCLFSHVGAKRYLHHSPLQRPPLMNKSYLALKKKKGRKLLSESLSALFLPSCTAPLSEPFAVVKFLHTKERKRASNQSSFPVTSLVAHLPYLDSSFSCVCVCVCLMP